MTDTPPSDPNVSTYNGRKIQWDDKNLRSNYANVANVASTREEVMFLFGTSQNWHNGQDDVVVELSNRMIMTPSAAKRLLIILHQTVEQYEKQFGKIG